jgi:DHA2 family multidrug resistance protein-like MFS transporter
MATDGSASRHQDPIRGGGGADWPGLSLPRRHVAAAAVLLAVAMSVLLGSIVNLGLPIMAEELGVPPAQVVWVVIAYQLTLLVSLLPCAALGEIVGYHRVFLAGLAGVALASLICALSQSLAVLVSARALQGIAAAGVMSVNGALLRHSFPAGGLGHAIGLNALVVALSGTLGPGLGALILSVGSWHWLFAVTLPPALLAGGLGMAALPRVAGASRPFDTVGAALNALAFGLFFISADRLPAVPLVALGTFVAAVVAAAALVRHQRSRPHPLLPLDLLALPSMGVALAGSVAGFASQMLALIALPFLMLTVWQIGPAESGALLLWWPLAVAALAPVAGRLADRLDTAVLCAAGSGLLCAALVLLSRLADAPPYGVAILSIAACGVGFGLFQTPNARAILGSAPLHRSGGAGGMQATARQSGQSLGTVAAAAIFQLRPHDAAMVCIEAAAGLALLACALSLARWLRRPAGRAGP